MTYDRPSAGLRLSELEELELTIEKLVAGGDGLGRFEGIPIFVPRSAPGDRVRVRLFERKPDYGRAEILEILVAGPGRREPPCRYFARCGGCDLQHLEEGVQTRLKAAALLETVRRISGVAVPEPSAVVSGQAWAYRLRTQLHTRAVHGGFEVGYFARRSRDLVAVASCPVLAPPLEKELATLARRLPERVPARIDLASGDAGQVSYAPLVEGLPHGELKRRIGSFEYRFDARIGGILGAKPGRFKPPAHGLDLCCAHGAQFLADLLQFQQLLREVQLCSAGLLDCQDASHNGTAL